MEGEGGKAPADRFLWGAAAATAAALADIPLLIWLIDHQPLPLWLHVPVTGVALAVLSLGALAAGVLLVEWRIARGLPF
ncbi:hypothetical protein [Caldinitratiruptor microaerophilus]|uniref:Uncharacterized protein n=1 Tax=Caldinitratiruptor microaerophilus TaxID=671077 RepID=A0AA35G8F3_9FIRM|nr:hypothetical protein [Caldinitratiruptor microaerophilus]BDG60965.1 hypothetical protein caldi_20550 [Caldinitratiruptor microaerophilus]